LKQLYREYHPEREGFSYETMTDLTKEADIRLDGRLEQNSFFQHFLHCQMIKSCPKECALPKEQVKANLTFVEFLEFLVRLANMTTITELEFRKYYPGVTLEKQNIPLHLKVDVVVDKFLRVLKIEKAQFTDKVEYY